MLFFCDWHVGKLRQIEIKKLHVVSLLSVKFVNKVLNDVRAVVHFVEIREQLMDIKQRWFKKIKQRPVLSFVKRYLSNHSIFLSLLVLNVIVLHLKWLHDPLVLIKPLVAWLFALCRKFMRNVLTNNKRVVILLYDEWFNHCPFMFLYFHLKIPLLLLLYLVNVLALYHKRLRCLYLNSRLLVHLCWMHCFLDLLGDGFKLFILFCLSLRLL